MSALKKLGLAVVALAVMAGAAGCGGGSSSGDFVANGNKICNETNAKIKAVPKPTSVSDVKPFLDKTTPIVTDAVDQVKGLTPPDSDQAGYDAWVKTLEAELAAQKKAQSQAGSDPQAAITTVKGSQALNDKGNQQARAIGLADCGKDTSGGSSGSSGSS